MKNGKPATHYLEGDELRALRRECADGPFMFVTERGGPLTRSTVNKLVEWAGRLAGIEFPVHPHMLRHACGYYLANKGIDTRTIQDFLGHVSITHTVRYTDLSPHNTFHAPPLSPRSFPDQPASQNPAFWKLNYGRR